MLRSIAIGLVAAVFSLVAAAAALASPKVVFETTLGAFTVELNEERAPKTVENFLAYVDSGFYDGVVFHRVKKDFMAQGGGFELKGEELIQKPNRGNIVNEADNGLRNMRGTIAMARQPSPHTASSQFFINLVDNKFLNHKKKTNRGWGYAVFGKVIEGMDVVDQMVALGTKTKILTASDGRGGFVRAPFEDVPVRDIVILSAKRAE